MAARVSIRPSALGSKGLLLFAALELAFLATNYSNLFFLLLAFSAVLGVLGAVWSWRNLRGLELASFELAHAAAGSQRTTRTQLRAAARPRFDLLVEVPFEKGYGEAAYTPLLHGEVAVDDHLAGQPRGVHAIDHVRITSHFPFGFFVAQTRLATAKEIVTYPTPLPCDAAGRAGEQDGDSGALHAGRGAALAGLRAFRTGDALADVHWKATARRGAPVVKERERESATAIEAVLDRRCDPEALEHALSQLTTLVLAARTDAPLHLHSQGIELLVDPDRGGADEALRWLAGASPLGMDAPAPKPRRGALQFGGPQSGGSPAQDPRRQP